MDPVVKVLEISGFSELNPFQQKAVEAGLLEDGNFVIAAPTASGKTLLAEITALDTIRKGKKVIYIVPLRALATEKYEEFKKYEEIGIKVGISIGDLDRSDNWLIQYDIIIVTSEKLDSLLRHKATWINLVGLVVVDEIHLLDSPNRGPTLEIVLTRLRQACNPKILGLSATINNYEDLANWLDAKSMKSDYRPVDLFKGICFENKIKFSPSGEMELNSSFSDIANIVYDTLEKKKQSLVFVSTRRSAQTLAEKIGYLIKNRINREGLDEIAEKVEKALDHTTEQCRKLANCIRMGVAFHHAGLVNKQRKLVENGFKKGLIKFITATPTLAAGINLPAYRVIIRDLKRFYSYKGIDFIPNLEIEQMCGRAGRPKYDSKGEAILLPKNNGEAVYAWKNYIKGKTEDIYSKLGVEPVLRTHVLALIASGISTREELFNFFQKTFYAYQYKDFDQLKIKLENVLKMLRDFNFINISQSSPDNPFISASEMIEDDTLMATDIGKRVSELYIDPITADYLIKSLEKPFGSWFSILHMICRCMEMKPLLSVSKKDADFIENLLSEELDNLIDKPPNIWDIEYDDYMASIKTAGVFYSWIEEKGEDYILENFSVSPGELKARLEIIDWLLYSTQELAHILNKMDLLAKLKKIRMRTKYGVKEELLTFIKLKGIGRVKARSLFRSGVKNLEDLKKIPLDSLGKIVGYKTAEKIKDQL